MQPAATFEVQKEDPFEVDGIPHTVPVLAVLPVVARTHLLTLRMKIQRGLDPGQRTKPVPAEIPGLADDVVVAHRSPARNRA
jgi:hypothetical protein